MPLDEAGRKERATKAGKVSGKKRTNKTWQRDIEIYDAYLYLIKDPTQTKQSYLIGYEFLITHGISARIKKDDPTPYRKLADALGLTRQRIEQIIKKEKKIRLVRLTRFY